jgi:2-polyprenyl-6-methoxyphenol hydroxylase-like FAD-dependent oxidoreductase
MARVGLQIAIVGAGVGGLTSALSLSRQGHSVRVFEKGTELREVGAAVSLWPNALAALDRVGIEGDVLSQGHWEEDGAIRSPSGWEFTSFNNSNLLILRTLLQQILLKSVEGVPIVLGARCIDVSSREGYPIVHLNDGGSFECDLVVGADGIRSAVRRAIAPDDQPLRYSGVAAWRGIVRAPGLVTKAWLSIGGGLQFLGAPLTNDSVFWSPLVKLSEGQQADITDHRQFLSDLFSRWHEPIPTLLRLTPEEDYIPTEIYFRPPPKWLHKGRVVLVGDAAHPMTPDLGQGACQAIEDGVVLGECIARSDSNVDAALAEFKSRRLSRVCRVVREARLFGTLNAAKNLPVTLLRTGALRFTPASFTEHRLSAINSRKAFESQLLSVE